MIIPLRSEHWKQLGGAFSMKYGLWWQALLKLSLVLICRRVTRDIAAGAACDTSVLISEQYPMQYRRPCRMYLGGIWEPGFTSRYVAGTSVAYENQA